MACFEASGRNLSKTSVGRWRTPENTGGRLENKRLAESQFAKKRGVEPSQRKTRSRCPEAGAKTKNRTAKLYTSMTTKLQNLVTEAVSLDRKIAEQTERLKEFKAQLVEAARERQDELTPTDGGGLRWTADGSDGCIARVNFPAPALKSKIDGEGKTICKIKQFAGAFFSRLFVPTISFKPVENFRDEAKALLAKGDATKLIKFCQTESAPRVSFETAERTALAA